jgi:hypothetical protein
MSKKLIGAAIALAVGPVVAALVVSAHDEPIASATPDPNRFGGLGCNCQHEVAPQATGGWLDREISRGIRAGLAATAKP